VRGGESDLPAAVGGCVSVLMSPKGRNSALFVKAYNQRFAVRLGSLSHGTAWLSKAIYT
jgi:hypothetical protein